jgi:hypothetical protein
MLAMVAVESRWSRGGCGGLSGVVSSLSRWVTKAWACGLEIWTADLETFNGNIFNGKSGDLFDGCGVFGVDGCGFVVGFGGGLAHSGSWWVYFEVVVVSFWSTSGVGWWGLAPRWVEMACRVACGGFLGGSRW